MSTYPTAAMLDVWLLHFLAPVAIGLTVAFICVYAIIRLFGLLLSRVERGSFEEGRRAGLESAQALLEQAADERPPRSADPNGPGGDGSD